MSRSMTRFYRRYTIYIIVLVFVVLIHSSCGSLYYSYGVLTKKYDSTMQWKARKVKDNPKPQVSGIVIDKQTGDEIPFATIILSNKTRTYGTNGDLKGCFSFSDTIQPGNYHVECGNIFYYNLLYDSLYIKPYKKIELRINLRTWF